MTLKKIRKQKENKLNRIPEISSILVKEDIFVNKSLSIRSHFLIQQLTKEIVKFKADNSVSSICKCVVLVILCVKIKWINGKDERIETYQKMQIS